MRSYFFIFCLVASLNANAQSAADKLKGRACNHRLDLRPLIRYSLRMNFDPAKSIHDFPIVAFDTETSGAYPIENEIIELGAVKWQNGQVVGKFNGSFDLHIGGKDVFGIQIGHGAGLDGLLWWLRMRRRDDYRSRRRLRNWVRGCLRNLRSRRQDFAEHPPLIGCAGCVSMRASLLAYISASSSAGYVQISLNVG